VELHFISYLLAFALAEEDRQTLRTYTDSCGTGYLFFLGEESLRERTLLKLTAEHEHHDFKASPRHPPFGDLFRR
jgi:hypothetical protein